MLALLLVLLTAGAIVNIAVAWGCVLRNPGRFTQWESIEWRDPWPTAEGAEWPPPVIHADRVTSFGLDVTLLMSASESPLQLVLFRAGMPLRAMTWHAITDEPSFGTALAVFLQLGPGWTDGLAVPRWSAENHPAWKRLPLRPIWPGFAINTIFYATILWGLFAMPFALRKRRRIKRGLCPKCAYDLRGTNSQTCPECGAAVPPRRGAGM